MVRCSQREEETMSETAPAPSRRDVYREITDYIIAAIEKGAGDFEMPWHREVGSTLPTNALTGNVERTRT